MSKVSERDVLRKVCTRIAEIGGLKGISSRNLNNIESARKGVKELLDEYADKKHLAELERLKENFNIVKTISDKITEENCKLKTENHDLKALLKDKNAIISEITTENNKLRAEKDNLNDVIFQYREIVEKLKKENKWLKEENDFLSQPWYVRLFNYR
ncbi:hypothetical protein [uncultured Fusobacterium sp.]|uniref:hypothetical protein n=1 Tax=uncultured Fusobacterium sp. TaxID=159267 RepID=UPI0025D72A47|nr:hypothetical protein [uncultured Fusobacterium sp.]